MRQRVLSIENRYVSSLIAQRAFHSDENIICGVKERIRSFGKFVDREWAESHSSVKQIIACGIVTNRQKILCLRRSKKSNRRELRLNWTLMFGGHVDEDDMETADPISNCVVREIKEEIGLEAQSVPYFLGYITDPMNPVGRLHIGAVFKFESTSDIVKYSKKLDNYEFANATKKLTLEFCEPRFVANLSKRNRLDPWSDIFVQSSAAIRDDVTPTLSEQQLEIPFHWSDFGNVS